MLGRTLRFFLSGRRNTGAVLRLLGSQKEQKKHLLYDTSHNIPRKELIKESLDWLDLYLGPVQ